MLSGCLQKCGVPLPNLPASADVRSVEDMGVDSDSSPFPLKMFWERGGKRENLHPGD